jgi:hypothetical protein
MDIAPYSGAIEAATNFGNAIISRIWPDKTKVAELQAQFQQAVVSGEYANELATIQAVNATMQAEAKSEHWAQWMWRPMIGFTFAGTILNNYVLLPYFAKLGLQPVTIPDNIWTAMLVILGASAATRGWQKVVEAQKK